MAVGWLRYVGLDEMVHAMMNEFFSPSSFRRRMAALPPSLPPSSSLFPSSFLPSLPSLRKRLRQKQRRPARPPKEGARLFSTRKERGRYRYRSSAAADADDGEGRRERGGAVVRFTRSVREATVPLIIADRAGGAGGGCSPNDRPSLSTLPRWILHLPDSSWGSC